MSNIIMYDSTTATDIPVDAMAVAGYADGRYKWTAADWARFHPQAIRVRIAVFASTNDGHVLDVEPGCATPAQAPGWIRMRKAAGLTVPCLYVALWTPTGWAKNIYETTKDALVAAGIDPASVAWFVANYDGKGEVPPGFVAKQYANDVMSHGHFDLSVVGPTAPWMPVPVIVTAQGGNMKGYVKVALNGAVYAYGDVKYCGGFEHDLSNGELLIQVKLTASHQGYVGFGNKGGIFTKGDAPYLGGGGDTNPAGFLAADAG